MWKSKSRRWREYATMTLIYSIVFIYVVTAEKLGVEQYIIIILCLVAITIMVELNLRFGKRE